MPILTVTLTTGGTVYAATATRTLASTVAIQAHAGNTAAVYFNDQEDPVSASKTGLEFAAPSAGAQIPIFGIGGDGNPVELSQLRFVSPTNAQKMIVFYKQL